MGESEDFWEKDSEVSSLAIQHSLVGLGGVSGDGSGERAGYRLVCIPARPVHSPARFPA